MIRGSCAGLPKLAAGTNIWGTMWAGIAAGGADGLAGLWPTGKICAGLIIIAGIDDDDDGELLLIGICAMRRICC